MTTPERPPVFELHIRPLFRLLDRAHMLTQVAPGIDLWNLDAVWGAREEILTRVRGQGSQNMPGLPVGGPWPAEWITLFERWIATGSATAPGHHLVLAKPDRDYELKNLGGDRRRLSAMVTAPTEGCRLWFELDSVATGQRGYTLYLEPAFPGQPSDPTPLRAAESLLRSEVERVVVRDADGTRELVVP
jgi:hypothetical protein